MNSVCPAYRYHATKCSYHYCTRRRAINKAPKNKTSSARGQRKGKKTPLSSSKPAESPAELLDPPADILNLPADDEANFLERSSSSTPPRERSRESSVSSTVSNAASHPPAGLMTKLKRRKGPRRTPATSALSRRS